MPILSLLAKLGLDKTGFDAGMTAAGHQVEHFGEHLKSHLAAAFGAGALIALTERVLELGKDFSNLSVRMGTSVETAQEFSLAAKLGESDAEFMATKFDKLKQAMAIAISGGKNPLEQFGFSVEQLKNTKPEDVFRGMASAIKETGMTADQAVAAMDIFGRGATRVSAIILKLAQARGGTIFFSKENLEAIEHAETVIAKAKNNITVLWGKFLELWPKLQNPAKFFAPPEHQVHPEPMENEEQLLHDMKEREKEAEIHMAIMDRVAAMDKDSIRLEAEAHKAGLTDAQRKNELLKERVTLMENLRTMVGDMPAAEEEARAMMRKRLAEVNLEVNRLDQKKTPPVHHALNRIENTRLGAIGGGLGLTGANTEQIARDTLKAIKDMREDMIRRGILVKAWR